MMCGAAASISGGDIDRFRIAIVFFRTSLLSDYFRNFSDILVALPLPTTPKRGINT
jgi:hypothetical protein